MEIDLAEREDVISYDYKFYFENGITKEFSINLDPVSLLYIPQKRRNLQPYWTKLEYYKCGNCPFKHKDRTYCPIALNFVDLYDHFNTLYSYKIAEVVICTRERKYAKKTTIQQSLGSLLGIIMVTSGCPIMDKLKPMVRFHLPFATLEETVFRSVSVYLLGQYFSRKRGLDVDLELNQLKSFYLDIQHVNVGIANRLRTVTQCDAFANAIISLDAFAKELPYSIEEQLKDMEYLFESQRS